MSVIVTPTAIKEVGDIMKQQSLNPETTCLRVGVKGGGCSGFSYLLDLTENQKETDEVWTCGLWSSTERPAKQRKIPPNPRTSWRSG